MGQMLVRNLDDTVKQRLRQRAMRNGRSVEAEARDILSAAVTGSRTDVAATGLGTRIAARFAGIADEPLGLSEVDWGPAHPLAFD